MDFRAIIEAMSEGVLCLCRVVQVAVSDVVVSVCLCRCRCVCVTCRGDYVVFVSPPKRSKREYFSAVSW